LKVTVQFLICITGQLFVTWTTSRTILYCQLLIHG